MQYSPKSYDVIIPSLIMSLYRNNFKKVLRRMMNLLYFRMQSIGVFLEVLQGERENSFSLLTLYVLARIICLIGDKP